MFKKNNKKQLGFQGEQIAATYYKKLGWKIIKQNYWSRYGELDLILQKDNHILIVEVKTRRSYYLGYGEETISEQKLDHINQTYQILQQKINLTDNYSIEICIVELNNNYIKIRCFPV